MPYVCCPTVWKPILVSLTTSDLPEASHSLHLTRLSDLHVRLLHMQVCRCTCGIGLAPGHADPQLAKLGDKFHHRRSQTQQADMPALQRM